MNDIGAMLRVIKWVRNPGSIPYLDDLHHHGWAASELLRAIENCSDAEARQLVHRVMAEKGWARACSAELSIEDIKNLIRQHAGDKTLLGELDSERIVAAVRELEGNVVVPPDVLEWPRQLQYLVARRLAMSMGSTWSGPEPTMEWSGQSPDR